MLSTSEFQDYASPWVFGIGAGSNLFLLFVIYTVSRNEARGSRTILTIISIFNIYYALVVKIVHPTYILDERGFIALSKTFPKTSAASKVGLALFVNAFGQSLSLLMIHCFYRYVKITGIRRYRAIIEKRKGIIALVTWHFFISWAIESTCLISMQPSETRRQLSDEETLKFLNISLSPEIYYYGPVFSYPGPDHIEHYNWVMVFGTVIAMCFFCLLYGTTCLTGIKLYYYVKQNTKSRTAQRYQVQLLMLLLAQAISPFIFEFVPAFVALVGGTTGLIPHQWGIFIPLFFAGYSGCDAILVLILFKAYRRRTIEIFKFKWFPKNRSQIFHTGTDEPTPISANQKSAGTSA